MLVYRCLLKIALRWQSSCIVAKSFENMKSFRTSVYIITLFRSSQCNEVYAETLCPLIILMVVLHMQVAVYV